MKHELKCWPEYFGAVRRGEKPFEVRKWDRPYAVGDTLRLREYEPKSGEYTGDEITREVTYLLDMTYLPGDNIPKFAGYVVMGLADPRVEKLTADLAAMTAERDLKTIERNAFERRLSRLKQMLESMTAERDAMRERAEAAERDIETMLGTQRVCFACNNRVPCNNSTTGEYACDPKWRGPVAEVRHDGTA